MSSKHNDLVLYHYSFSPYARRIVWYLTLRGIDYAQCMQAPVLPRPDLTLIGVNYRRIPVLAHGKHAYCDTRLILSHLDEVFPPSSSCPSITPSSSFDQGVTRLLEKWIVEAGIFVAASQLLPADLPALKDPKFMKDREQFSGRSWKKEDVLRQRPAALVVFREAFYILEEQVLGDGREWVLGNGDKGPSKADIEAVWPFHWLAGIPGALPKEIISAEKFPKTFAWIQRFDAAIKVAKSKAPKPVTVKGPEAAKIVLGSKYEPRNTTVDAADPLGLKQGDEVEAYPTDSGFSHRDSGKLVGLNRAESVLQAKAPSGDDVYIHHPRSGFRVKTKSLAKL